MPSDAAVVGDHHQIVDLGSLPDGRRSVGAAIDGCIGADFDVGADFHVAQLCGNLVAPFDK